MANNDSRIDELKQEIKELRNEVNGLKEKQFDQCLVQTHDKAELKELIVNAVKDAMTEAQEKTSLEIEKEKESRSALEKRVEELENKDGKLAVKILVMIITTIITTTVGWVVLGYLNNQNAIAASNRVIASEVEKNEGTSQKINNKN